MSFEEKFCTWGIPTYIQTLSIDVTGINSIPIADTLPIQMGWIYGMNIYVDGFDPDNVALITTANAGNLFLKLVQGDRNFVNPIRLDDLIFPSATQSGRYMEMNVPGTISIDQSVILNPTGIGTGRIMLVLRYITIWDYQALIKEQLFRNGGFVRTKA